MFEAFIYKAFKGAAVVRLLQAFDNAINGRLGYARRVKIFEKFNDKIFNTNCYLPSMSRFLNNKRVSLFYKRPSRKFS